MLMSSSNSDQCMPSPSPMNRQLARSTGVPWHRSALFPEGPVYRPVGVDAGEVALYDTSDRAIGAHLIDLDQLRGLQPETRAHKFGTKSEIVDVCSLRHSRVEQSGQLVGPTVYFSNRRS